MVHACLPPCLAKVRSVKACAKSWEMESCKWMFNNGKDVDADVQVIMELRDQLTADSKQLDRILVLSVAAPNASESFKQALANGKNSMATAKACREG